MSTHLYGLKVTDLEVAWRAANTVDHAVCLVDDSSHTIVMVDKEGRLVIRCEEQR
jgi:hypothetical protein